MMIKGPCPKKIYENFCLQPRAVPVLGRQYTMIVGQRRLAPFKMPTAEYLGACHGPYVRLHHWRLRALGSSLLLQHDAQAAQNPLTLAIDADMRPPFLRIFCEKETFYTSWPTN